MTALPPATLPRLPLLGDTGAKPEASRGPDGSDSQFAGPSATFEDILNLMDDGPQPEAPPARTGPHPSVLVADRSGDDRLSGASTSEPLPPAVSEHIIPAGTWPGPASSQPPTMDRLDAEPAHKQPSRIQPVSIQPVSIQPTALATQVRDQVASEASLPSELPVVDVTQATRPTPMPLRPVSSLADVGTVASRDPAADAPDIGVTTGSTSTLQTRKRRQPKTDGLDGMPSPRIEQRSSRDEGPQASAAPRTGLQENRADPAHGTGLSLSVSTIFERAAVHVRLPAAWDVARDYVRELIASRLSGLGYAVDRIDVTQPQIRPPRQTGDSPP